MVVFNTVFQGVQLLIEMLNKDNTIHAYIPNLTWFCTNPLGTLIFVRFLLKKKEMWAFFEDWRQFENRVTITALVDCGNVKKFKCFIFIANFVIYCSIFIAICSLIFYRPEASYLLSHYKIMRDSFGFSFTTAFHSISLVVGFILFSLSDVVPGFIFCHAGLVLRSFDMQIQEQFFNLSQNNKILPMSGSCSFQIRIHKMCLRYEMLSQLVKRTNKLFGILMISNHATMLFMISMLFYSTLYQLKISTEESVIYFIAMATFIYLLVVGHLLAAQLHSASAQLRFSLSSLLSQHTIHLTKQEFDVASSFLGCLQNNQLAARPLNLYSVTASNLLSFTSLIISYVIVLLQA